MNIHFTDETLFDKLMNATLAKVKVGSHMYGTNNEKSDTDWLCIYATSENELNSFIQTNHQLQFKTETEDYNFVSLHTFLRNIVNGDSTINFEVVQSDVLIGTTLDWLSYHKNAFVTYTVIRSYLGFARRDVKHYHKYSDEYNKKKRLGHIIRGSIYARDMIYKRWNFNKANFELKGINLYVHNNKLLRTYEEIISNLRVELNDRFNNKQLGLAQHLNVEDANKLTNDLLAFCQLSIFKDKQKSLEGFDMSLFLNAFENWVEYDK